MKYNIITITILLILISTPLNANENKQSISPKQNYELSLTLNEYSVLNSALVSGLNKYGGIIEFQIKMKKEKNNIYWILSIQNKNNLKVLKHWIAEKSIEIISNVPDFSKLDKTSQIALTSIKSISAKIDVEFYKHNSNKIKEKQK